MIKSALLTTANVAFYALTGGRFLMLEGRMNDGRYRNWLGRYPQTPERWIQPTTLYELRKAVRYVREVRFVGGGRSFNEETRTEETLYELRRAVRDVKKVRVVGGGHSFNEGIRTEETLINLDNFEQVDSVNFDSEQGTAYVGAGMRLRDVNKKLDNLGYALEGMGSHDAQSIGGLISTDVHGTGRDWGFVSEIVGQMEVMDSSGDIDWFYPEEEGFKATVGAIGATGIVTAAALEVVPAFKVRQKVQTASLDYVQDNLETLLEENEHLSLYLFPFTDKVRINTWNRTEDRMSLLRGLREFLRTAVDAMGAAWAGGFLARTGLLSRFSPLIYGVERGSELVMKSYEAFTRTVYHAHEEMEMAVPADQGLLKAESLVRLYERMYTREKLPYLMVEVRFTPAGHDRTLIGPGKDRATAWINLCLNSEKGYERFYNVATRSPRLHLGKYIPPHYGANEIAAVHGAAYNTFTRIVTERDPKGKFQNELTRRLFNKWG